MDRTGKPSFSELFTAAATAAGLEEITGDDDPLGLFSSELGSFGQRGCGRIGRQEPTPVVHISSSGNAISPETYETMSERLAQLVTQPSRRLSMPSSYRSIHGRGPASFTNSRGAARRRARRSSPSSGRTAPAPKIERSFGLPAGAVLDGPEKLIAWERMQHPPAWLEVGLQDGIVSFSPLNALDQRWERFDQRTLLLLHGTFSSSEATFGATPELISALLPLYNGRMLAYSHPTMEPLPLANAQQMLDMLPPGKHLELDCLTHSRGGLVARCLSELPDALNPANRHIGLRKVVFTGTPNKGTRLAGEQCLTELIMRLHNALYIADKASQLLPVTGVPAVVRAIQSWIEGLLRVLKTRATDLITQLPGIGAMGIDSPFLQQLNTAHGLAQPAQYFAISAMYASRSWKQVLLNNLIARCHDYADNDLVVPDKSVHAYNGALQFPIADCLTLPRSAGVSHCTYFHNTGVIARIVEWLQ